MGHGSTFWMQELDPDRPLRPQMHVDGSVARAHAEEHLAAAVAAGGRIVEESEAPAAWLLSDRAGNPVCIVAWPDCAQPPATEVPGRESRSGETRRRVDVERGSHDGGAGTATGPTRGLTSRAKPCLLNL